jgi:hypothetical protein
VRPKRAWQKYVILGLFAAWFVVGAVKRWWFVGGGARSPFGGKMTARRGFYDGSMSNSALMTSWGFRLFLGLLVVFVKLASICILTKY